jgi:two-component system response regulator QseB
MTWLWVKAFIRPWAVRATPSIGCKDGSSALHALLSETFDVAVLDLGLPRMDGLEVLRRLRDSGSNLPVLILTARDATEDRIAGLDAGADDYLIKPFDLAELKARLRACCGAAPAARRR